MSSAAPGVSAPWRRPRLSPGSISRSAANAVGDADRDVDEEDPVPVDEVGEHAAGQEADRAARRGDEAVDADRLRLLARLREHRHDHPEHDGRGERAAGALDEARGDQHLLALRGRAQQRGHREDGQADQEHQPAADQVTEPSGEEEQAAERDQVRVDDPREAALREAEVLLDGRKRHVHDRRVQNDHQHADAQHVERHPAASISGGGGGHARAPSRSGSGELVHTVYHLIQILNYKVENLCSRGTLPV